MTRSPKVAAKTIEHEPVKSAPHAVVLSATPFDLLNRAVVQGATLEMVEKLMELYERWRASEAKRAYDNAIADAKGKFPKIEKTKSVGFQNKDKDGKSGGKTAYKHEGLDDIAVIDPVLSEHGLSWRHRAAQEGDLITVTCIVSHRDGYAEETSLRAASDKTGGKNDIQAIGSTVRYLTRYTLMLALGLAATDASPDDDGKAAGTGGPVSTERLARLKELCGITNTDEAMFADHMKVASLAELPDSQFAVAERKLLAKRHKQLLKAAAEGTIA